MFWRRHDLAFEDDPTVPTAPLVLMTALTFFSPDLLIEIPHL
jgi:hypothetical protein